MLAQIFLIIIVGLFVYILIDAMGQKQLAKLTFLLMVLMVINIVAPSVNKVWLKWQDTGRKVENLTKSINKLDRYDKELKGNDFLKKLEEFENAPWANWGAPKEEK